VTNSDVGTINTKTAEGSLFYVGQTIWGRYSLSGTERYAWYSATETLPSYTENIASFAVAAIRDLPYGIRLTCTANVFDDRSSIRSARDLASLRANLSWSVNKITVSVDGQTAWTFESPTISRADTITVDIQRFF
jgi:hypothetical protein